MRLILHIHSVKNRTAVAQCSLLALYQLLHNCSTCCIVENSFIICKNNTVIILRFCKRHRKSGIGISINEVIIWTDLLSQCGQLVRLFSGCRVIAKHLVTCDDIAIRSNHIKIRNIGILIDFKCHCFASICTVNSIQTAQCIAYDQLFVTVKCCNWYNGIFCRHFNRKCMCASVRVHNCNRT